MLRIQVSNLYLKKIANLLKEYLTFPTLFNKSSRNRRLFPQFFASIELEAFKILIFFATLLILHALGNVMNDE